PSRSRPPRSKGSMRSTHRLKSALSWPDAAEPVFGSGADPDENAGAASSRPPSVCFAAPLAWPILAGIAELKIVGGAEVQQSILARALAGAGFRVSMVCNDFGQADGVRVHGVTVHKTHRIDQGIPVVRFLHPRLSTTWAALRRANADIYYTRSSSMLAGVVAAFCRRLGRRLRPGEAGAALPPRPLDVRVRRAPRRRDHRPERVPAGDLLRELRPPRDRDPERVRAARQRDRGRERQRAVGRNHPRLQAARAAARDGAPAAAAALRHGRRGGRAAPAGHPLLRGREARGAVP